METKNFAVCCALTLFSCTKAPKMEIDIKNLSLTSDSLRSFKIANPGSDTLVIEDFTTSCECTALNLNKNYKIAPGDSMRVNIRINKEEQNSDNIIFVTIKTNAKPRLTSFQFKI